MSFQWQILELKPRFTEAEQRPLKGAMTGCCYYPYLLFFPLSQELWYIHLYGWFLFLTCQIPREVTIFSVCYIFTPEQCASCGDGEEPKYSGVLHPQSTHCLTFRGRCIDTQTRCGSNLLTALSRQR